MMLWFILTLLSALFSALMIIVAKKNLNKEHAMEFNGVRGFFTLLLLMFFLPFVDFSIHPKIVAIIFFVSILAALGIYYMARAIRHLDVSIIAPLDNIRPMFLVLLAFLILGEHLTLNQIFGIVLLLFGAYILQLDHSKKWLTAPFRNYLNSKFIHIGILAMFIFSVTAIFDKYIVDNFTTPTTYMFFVWFFISLHLLFIEAYTHGFNEIVQDLKKQGFWIFVMALFGVVASILFLFAIKYQDISLVVPIKRTSALFVTFFGGHLFHEKNLKIKMMACIIIIVGLYLIII